MLAAAENRLAVGEAPTARAPLSLAVPRLADALTRARARRREGQSLYAAGRMPEDTSVLLDTARMLQPFETRLARNTLLDTWAAAEFSGQPRAGMVEFMCVAGGHEPVDEVECRLGDLAPAMVDREGVAPVGNLHDLGHGGVAPLPLVGGVRDRPRHRVVLRAIDDQQRTAVGAGRVDLRLRPRVSGLTRNGPTPRSTEAGRGSTPRKTPGSIATVAAARPRPASICASKPPVECPMIAGLLSRASMISVVWSATCFKVFPATTSGSARACSTVSGSSGQSGVSG